MNKRNNKIKDILEIQINNKTVILICTILIIILTMCFVIKLTGFDEKINLFYKVASGQINIEKEIEDNDKLMGITNVSGQGVILNIDDGGDLMHQEDVIILIDELKNAGSQAISINGVRVVNSTYLFCDGGVILIDGKKIGNPFEIKAIGNKELIYGSLTRNNGYLSTLTNDKIEVNVEMSENIQIPKSEKQEFEQYLNTKNKIQKLYLSNRIVGKSDNVGNGLEIVIFEDKTKLSALTFIQLVNDLNSAGAKAISINGNRITNMTDMMDIGKKYTVINSNLITAPYIIEVNGDTEEITKKINATNSYFSKVYGYGDNISITHKIIRVEKYEEKIDQNKMLIDYLQ